MRRLHYLDPQLLGVEGHYFHYCEQAVRELASRGVETSIHGRQGSRLVCAGIPVQPLFTRDIFAEAWTDPEIWALENYHSLNRAFLAELLRLRPDDFSADDVAFFPSLIENQLHGVALWLGRLPAARRPAVVVLLRFLNQAMDYMVARPHHDLVPLNYRHACRALVGVQPRTVLCADTTEMAAAYRLTTGLPILPVSVAMEPLGPAAAAVQPRAAHDRPVVAFLGHTSKLRGFHQLPEIIDRCQSAGKGPRFLVQVQSRPAARAEDLGFVLDRLGAMPKADVSLVEGSLSTAQYFSLMAEADVVLLPYSPAFYGHCSSGVFAEAAAAGKVIVVPAGTVGARLGEEYGLGVVVAAGWNPKSLANAVGQAVNDLPRQRAKAMAAASRFGCEQGVASFWNQVLEAIPDPVLAAC